MDRREKYREAAIDRAIKLFREQSHRHDDASTTLRTAIGRAWDEGEAFGESAAYNDAAKDIRELERDLQEAREREWSP